MSEIIKWGGQKVQKNPRDGQLESLIEEILALIEKLPSLQTLWESTLLEHIREAFKNVLADFVR